MTCNWQFGLWGWMWFISPASSIWSPQKAEECKARQRWHHTSLNGKKPRSALSLGFVLITFRMHTHDALLTSKECVCVCVYAWVGAFVHSCFLYYGHFKAHACACLHTHMSLFFRWILQHWSEWQSWRRAMPYDRAGNLPGNLAFMVW